MQVYAAINGRLLQQVGVQQGWHAASNIAVSDGMVQAAGLTARWAASMNGMSCNDVIAQLRVCELPQLIPVCLVPAAVPWTSSDSPWDVRGRPCHPAQQSLQQLRSWHLHSRWCCLPTVWLAFQLTAPASALCQSQVCLGKVDLVESLFYRFMLHVVHGYRKQDASLACTGMLGMPASLMRQSCYSSCLHSRHRPAGGRAACSAAPLSSEAAPSGWLQRRAWGASCHAAL